MSTLPRSTNPPLLTGYPLWNDYEAWDQCCRTIIQDPYPREREAEWQALLTWLQWMHRRTIRRGQQHRLWDPEDVLQQIAEWTIRALESYDPTRDPHPSRWVWRSVRYGLGKWERHEQHRKTAESQEEPPDEAMGSIEEAVLTHLSLEDTMRQILTVRERAVLYQGFWGEWSDAQIHEVYGWSLDQIRKIRQRGLEKLRRWIDLANQDG